MQTGPDLISAGYPSSNPVQALFGATNNVVQPNLPAFTNLSWLGLSGVTDGAAVATGVATVVAVPIVPGVTVSKISVFAGATAEATGTHAWAALYSGVTTPALLSQSADNTGAAAVGASARMDFGLATPQLITAAVAPYGYVYAAICVTATTVPTLMSSTVAAAVDYQLYTTGPAFLAARAGSALGASAAATVASASANATVPIVALT